MEVNNKKNNTVYDVLIVGGGASGMMAGACAGALGKKVMIIDKNHSLGEKLKITGGGRCNITNGEENVRVFMQNYGKAEPFLYSAFSRFGMKDTFKYFEDRGLPLVIQARKRAFPHTEKAIDVCNLLKKELDKNKVESMLGVVAKKVNTKDGKIVSVTTNKGEFFAKSFILSTGGMSHPETGATGDGFNFLKELGHTIKEPTPSIVPLEVAESWVHMLAGVSLSFMKITFFLEDKKAFSKTGKVLFTHFGLSGPLILNSASKVSDLLNSGKVTAIIDAYPDTNHGALDTQITKVFDANKNKILKTVFKEIVPEGTHKAIQMLLENDPDVTKRINFETKVHSVTKEERKRIMHLLKALPVTITNLMGYDRAVVADGGVLLNEVDMKNMRSNLYPNLYITGDLLNINRPSGGYGLQLCWTTGFIAGEEA